MTQQDRTAVQYHKMTETPIPRLILSLAAPTILSMLITSIYNLADTFFVGRISTSASGAVGVVSSLMAIIQALGFMLGHGSGTIISRRLCSQDTHAATRFASTSFITALAFGVVLAVVGLATLPDFMMLLGSTDTILPHACAYARPILIAAPLMMSSLVMNIILRYEGKASFAMIGLVTGGVLNIVLDPVFIFGLGMVTGGAGTATALSQSISFCILLSMFLRGKTGSQRRLSAVTREPREFLQILAGGAPSFGRQGLNSIGGMLLNIAARSYGDAAVAGMSIVSRIFQFLLLFFQRFFRLVQLFLVFRERLVRRVCRQIQLILIVGQSVLALVQLRLRRCKLPTRRRDLRFGRLRRLRRRHGHAHDLAARLLQAQDLLDGRACVLGLCVAHRLDGDRRAAADGHAADHDLLRHASSLLTAASSHRGT